MLRGASFAPARVATVLALVCCGCGAERRPDPMPSSPVIAHRPAPELASARVVLDLEGREPVEVRVEVARTDSERRRGLMWRRHLARSSGMLFVFERQERQVFWMRNTFVPLDLIFIDAAHRVVGVVERATPLTEDDRAVGAASQYVLEVHAGFAEEHGLSLGTPVRFVDLPEE
jgi:uncharacterized membrane protein (UPF0127 family)